MIFKRKESNYFLNDINPQSFIYLMYLELRLHTSQCTITA